MIKPSQIEFGYICPVGFSETCGSGFAPALRHAIEIARKAFKSLWFFDHFMFGDEEIHESWTLLCYAANIAPEMYLGNMVLCNSFRPPSLVAKMSASIQSLTEGKFVLGYGAGWHKSEYLGYGYEFLPAATRIAMMEEGLTVIKAMWHQSPVTFHGQYYHIEDAWCIPRPEPIPPIMIGGGGEQLTLRAVARHADWWNLWSPSVDISRHKLQILERHCINEGRDFASIRKTWAGLVYIDRQHDQALARAGDRIKQDDPPLAGDPESIKQQIKNLANLGFDLFQLGFPLFPATHDIELFIEEVLPVFS